MAAEVQAVLGQRPDLALVEVVDGTEDNRTFLTGARPDGVELIDFHAAEQLGALDAACGADSPKAVAQFEKHRHRPRHESDGGECVIRALVHLCSKHLNRDRIAQVVGDFRGNRRRMGYADARHHSVHQYDAQMRITLTFRHSRASGNPCGLDRTRMPIPARWDGRRGRRIRA